MKETLLFKQNYTTDLAWPALQLVCLCQTVVLTVCVLVHDILFQIPLSRMDIYSRL